MSKFDTCIFAEYFGDYGMRLCNHPLRGSNKTIYANDCRKCKCHLIEKDALNKCPFCGGNAMLSNYCGEWHVKCRKCNVEMKDDNIDTIREKWNRRVKGN